MGAEGAAGDWTELAGKTVVVTGLKNRKSVAWHVTRQLEEVGLARELGYGHGDDIVAAYPRLFWGPMMEMTAPAMRYLRFTAQGKHWLSRVHAQMLVLEHAELQG